MTQPVLPLSFQPLYKTRVWGGRNLASRYQRDLPDEQPYGESWEIVDRADDQSVVHSGPFADKTLHELWKNHRNEIFGESFPDSERFPLLIKILDCQEDLSVQVHPPADLAPSLGGEPKTEMWYLAQAEPHASLYVGLRNGVTRDDFEKAINDGTVAEVVHRIQPQSDDSIFIASGRLHAIGGGNLIFEIQQNSDTTYRVFDWNRVGLDGKPRELHIDESLASIDFEDFEPEMDQADGDTLASCPYFQTDRLSISSGSELSNPNPESFSIVAVVSGSLQDQANQEYQDGDFLLLPRHAAPLKACKNAEVLQITLPK